MGPVPWPERCSGARPRDSNSDPRIRRLVSGQGSDRLGPRLLLRVQSRPFAPQPVTSGLRWGPDMPLRCASRRDGPLGELKTSTERCEGERRRENFTAAVSSREHDSQDPNGGKEGANPRLTTESAEKAFHVLFSLVTASARSASTMMRTAPWAPICQSGEIRRKIRKAPASASVGAPTTAPMGVILPPMNSPPPRMTRRSNKAYSGRRRGHLPWS